MNICKAFKKNKLFFLVAFVYIVLMITMPQKALQSGRNSMYYVKEMFQIMPVIFILTSLIEAWVPRETIIKGFGEGSGFKGSILSFILGSFSAGPIYAAFPVCKMLLKKGASISNIVIILSSWAVVKVPMLANEAKFLGFKFMGIRWILTTISIFIMAYIMSKLINNNDIPTEAEKEKGDILEIKEQYCIGCGVCTKISPENFNLVDGKAKVINKKILPTKKDSIYEIIKKCPVKAIYLK
ncbi:hypothetical protein K144316041_07060 [Clostridium tetani]|uniref:Permease n=1 Tax=Clostridium tetani TaxID=1513 RepID=A0A4Q0VGR7_CLOTA|nr:permease [Clostridium tetani]RXI50487.1 permease [Clostridium tetani]BDR66496.1 hypothetical protein K144312032_07240 [Clostridium tetani]BDR71998.1 hypothetical protein K144316041_07060 [Clostridium tetani]BDR80472.1 hypothetical protein K234311028_07180 [Clostridium tetani]BDR88927.1 hypothetical protein N072000002_07280 [Clostridium tetani]